MIRPNFLILIFVLSTSTFNLKAQNEKTHRSLNIIPRAKVLSMVAIEDLWATSFSGGIELRFLEQFSFIADVVHYHRKEEEEVYVAPNYNDYDEYALKDSRNYMAYELRYYPRALNQDPFFRPYISAMGKVGKRFLHVQDKYPIAENQIFRINGTLRDLGGLIGFTIGENFGFDLNLGAAYRWETRSEDILLADDEVKFTSGVLDNRWQACIRASFFYNFRN